jgi:hypothetical protein
MTCNIENHWQNIKEWWNNLEYDDYTFDDNVKKVSIEEKKIYHIKVLFILKRVLELNDINDIFKKNYKIETIVNNISKNIDLLNLLIQDDPELKKYLIYLGQYKHYLSLLKDKLIAILNPIIHDPHYLNLFNCDDDITRILAPFAGSIFYIYLITRNIEKTLEIVLKLDNIYIRFFTISYLIIDNFMDTTDTTDNSENDKKKIFLKWFMKIVYNPDNEITINPQEDKIWQCHSFKKYFIEFIKEYPYSENKDIYQYVIEMIQILHEANNVQKNNKSTEDKIIEYTFKKSYVVSFFMGIIINKKIGYNLDDNNPNMFNICKLLFLIQLYDDYFDYDKDVDEINYTYFNSINQYYSPISFTKRVQKMICASKMFFLDMDEENEMIRNILIYVVKNTIILFFQPHREKIDTYLHDYFANYSILSNDVMNYFPIEKNKYYNPYKQNFFIKYLFEKIDTLV